MFHVSTALHQCHRTYDLAHTVDGDPTAQSKVVVDSAGAVFCQWTVEEVGCAI